VCKQLQTDPQNCGTCGHICPASTPSCVAGVCVCTGASCAGLAATPCCNTASGTCVAAVNCPPNAPACINNVCAGCTQSSQCPAATPVCNNNQCVTCQNNFGGAAPACPTAAAPVCPPGGTCGPCANDT